MPQIVKSDARREPEIAVVSAGSPSAINGQAAFVACTSRSTGTSTLFSARATATRSSRCNFNAAGVDCLLDPPQLASMAAATLHSRGSVTRRMWSVGPGRAPEDSART